MKKSLFAGALIALGAPFLASAQCPAGVTPDTYLVGKNFAFQVTSRFADVGAIGTIMAFPNGYLMVTETVVDLSGSNGQRVSRLAPASGRWMSNATCTGGMLMIMLNREFFQFDFTVVTTPGPTQGNLTLVGLDNSYSPVPGVAPGVPVQHFALAGCVGPVTILTAPSCISPGFWPGPPTVPNSTPVAWAEPLSPARLTGTAFLNPPKACPAGLGNPLNLLKGVSFVTGFTTPPTAFTIGNEFLTFSFLNPFAYSGDITVTPIPAAAVGIWPGPPTPANMGLTGTPGNPTNLAALYTGGRYIIYPDCSGGELLLMGNVTSGIPTGPLGSTRNAFTQIEFVFIDQTFTRIVGLNDGGQTP